MKFSVVLITLVVLLALFSPFGLLRKACRSHDSFMFLCRHDDTNTDIYLRRISEKLDRIFEQNDKRPDGVKDYDKIEYEAYKSRSMVSCLLKQLQLLKAGNLKTGFLARIIPTVFLHYHNEEFDRLSDVIVSSLTEYYHYTKEEVHLLRAVLLERWMSDSVIQYCGLGLIKGELYDLQRYEMCKVISEENDFNIPDNLYWILKRRIADPRFLKQESIMKAIDDGKIKDLEDLSDFIRDVFKV